MYQQQQYPPWMMTQQQQYPPWMMTQQQHQPAPVPGGADEVRSLWIGDLQYWMNEMYLFDCFSFTKGLVSTKVIRNKQTMVSERYGFLEFASRAVAEKVLQSFNGSVMPLTEDQCFFRMNWARGAREKPTENSPEHTIFVGNLAPEVTEDVLQETFKKVYKSVKGAKVITDKVTGRSKGYGFVKFGDEREQQQAMTEMDGVVCCSSSTRKMSVGPAAYKKTTFAAPTQSAFHVRGGMAQQQTPQELQQQTPQQLQQQTPQQLQQQTPQQWKRIQREEQNEHHFHQLVLAPHEALENSNTTIFVFGLDPSVTCDFLKEVFSQYGKVVSVDIPLQGRGNCGSVEFAEWSCAVKASSTLHGTTLGGRKICLTRLETDKDAVIWSHGLDPSINEDKLKEFFSKFGEVVKVMVQVHEKLVYGTVEFSHRSCAEKACSKLNGIKIRGERMCCSVSISDALFVLGLDPTVDPSVTEETLKQLCSPYGEIVKVCVEVHEKKAHGTLEFAERSFAEEALSTSDGSMFGVQNNRKPWRVYDSNIIWVDGLDPSITDDDLKQLFSKYGELVEVVLRQVPSNHGHVEFAKRSCAEQAKSSLHGTMLRGQNICLLLPPR